MICKQCGTNLPEESLFCYKCGCKIEEVEEKENLEKIEIKKEKIEEVQTSKKNKITLNKNLFVAFIIAIIVIIFALTFSIFRPSRQVLSAIDSNNYEKAKSIFVERIERNTSDVEKVKAKIIEEIENTKQSYLENNISYDDAIAKFEGISKLGILFFETSEGKKYVLSLKNSREAFLRAEEYLNSGNTIESIKEYKKVIDTDSNHANALSQIETLLPKYKGSVLKQIEELVASEDYKTIIKILDEATNILPDDEELKSKKSVYSKLLSEQVALQKEQEIAKLRDSQELIVQSVNIEGPGFLNSNDAYVVVKNTSDKVVKKYTVGILTFDNEGYPVTPSYEDNNVSYGNCEANIQPNAIYGNNSYWNIFGDQIYKIKACVKEVEYHDGATWINEYFNYWYENEKSEY